ncbi:MAG: hypothetical protein M3044_04220 [Thermoproteota archaeon]|nr:hypothetical protein [Thermoproteota archaeon]
MNHKIARITRDHKIATVLVAIAALAAVLVANAAGVESGHIALAGKGNDGISLPTDTKQKQECQTAGGTSPVTGSCLAASINNVTNDGGVMGEVTK